MDFLTFGLNQQCTYWAVTGVDSFNQPTFSAPATLECRWEERAEKIQTNEGVEKVSKARVFLAQDVDHHGYLALGVHAGTDPRQVPAASRIQQFAKIPSLDGLSFERKAYL